ncbi:stage II sporulation protein M [Candidatus Woesearchaeota archaeon]|nr:stage II sporulation protein M [Candidatus Woesearchaeota archaeon]MBW3006044.1 stage II sporulation protein M [Candidatus Woesearchaeota archaeon]
MVLESVLNPFTAAKRPWELLVAGIFYGSAALFLSIWIFEEYSSLVMVFLTVLACIPLFYKTIRSEEAKDLLIKSESKLLREHGKAIMLLVLLFIGLTIAFSFWYVALPAETSSNVFKIQTQTIASLNQQVTASIAKFNLLNRIFLNNIKVLIFCILFSFIYGSGAIFILSWNASVIGAAAGNFIRTHLAQYAGAVGFSKVAAYFYASSLSILRYSTHGIPEILAYFVAGLAGGILSVAIIKRDFGTKSFERILLDSSDLILISVFILFIAALIEVFVTPLFF